MNSLLKDFIGNKPDDIIAFEGTFVGPSKTVKCDFLMPTDVLVSEMRAFSKEIQEATSSKEEEI